MGIDQVEVMAPKAIIIPSTTSIISDPPEGTLVISGANLIVFVNGNWADAA